MRSREDIESEIADLEHALSRLNDAVAEWTQAAADLTQSLATERAKNQSMGRGLGGMLFGSKYRSAVRRGAAAANAGLSRQAAEKRGIINENKSALKDQIREVKAEIVARKAELKAVGGPQKTGSSTALTALKKLKELHELGVLSDAEYEEKRAKLLDQV